MIKQFSYEKNSLIILLICLLVVLLIYPFFNSFDNLNFVLKISLSLVLIAAVNATTHKRSQLLVAAVLAILAIGTSWAELFDSTIIWLTFNLAFTILFIGYVIWVHLLKIMTTRDVSLNLLFGALSTYILMGFLMSFVYMLINIYLPNSFSPTLIQPTHLRFILDLHFFKFVYFSFVTLTTLGYGDIHPIAQQAQAFAYFEAIAGQFYLTILVARLVGLHISTKFK